MCILCALFGIRNDVDVNRQDCDTVIEPPGIFSYFKNITEEWKSSIDEPARDEVSAINIIIAHFGRIVMYDIIERDPKRYHPRF